MVVLKRRAAASSITSESSQGSPSSSLSSAGPLHHQYPLRPRFPSDHNDLDEDEEMELLNDRIAAVETSSSSSSLSAHGDRSVSPRNRQLPMYFPSSRSLDGSNHSTPDHLLFASDGYSPRNSFTNMSASATSLTLDHRRQPSYMLLVSGLLLLACFYYTQSHATLRYALEQVDSLRAQRQSLRSKLLQTEQDLKALHSRLMADWGPSNNHHRKAKSQQGRQSQQVSSQMAEIHQEMQQIQSALRKGSNKVGFLQKHVQATSKRDAITKYGFGPFYVELELEFPEAAAPPPKKNPLRDRSSGASVSEDEDASDSLPHTILLELAPLNLMPHSVYTFLEMVSLNLIDGCSFILNALHVIKAAPLPYQSNGSTSSSSIVQAFANAGLSSVAFSEYSPEYPHEAYTVGFAADGSPSFYINTQDNTDIHVGDPCFAKVIRGLDTVKRLEEAPTRNGIWFKQRIGIKHARLVSDPGPVGRSPTASLEDGKAE